MVVEVFTGDGDDEATEEIEFSMLDQADFGGINEDYVARHGLQDRSMADQRKAKRQLAENAKRKKGAEGTAEDVSGHAEEDDGMTELERAQMEAEQQLQDDEDEDEEDYDPGSEGESEGSGTSSEEDEDADGAEGEEMDDDDDDEVGEDD